MFRIIDCFTTNGSIKKEAQNTTTKVAAQGTGLQKSCCSELKK